MPPKRSKKMGKGKEPEREPTDEPAQSDEERPPRKRSRRNRKEKEPMDEVAQSDEEEPLKTSKRKGKRKAADREPTDEPAQSSEERPAKISKKTGKGKKPEKKLAEEPAQSDEENEEGPPKPKEAKKEQGRTGPGIRARLTVAGDAPVRLDTKAQALRSLRKKAAEEEDTAVPFPAYGNLNTTKQTAKFFSTISPQVSPKEDLRDGYYPLASSMPANRGKTWNKIVIHRTCAVCGAWFHEGGGDGQYTEHMRLYHPEAPRSNLHGLPRVPHCSLIVGRTIPRDPWELIARADAGSRALFAALPGSEAFYTREQVRPNNVREFAADGDNPQPQGGHPFFPWDMDMLSRNNKPPPPPPLPRNIFQIADVWRECFWQLEEVIKPCIASLVESEAVKKPKNNKRSKAKGAKKSKGGDENTVDPKFLAGMKALEDVIMFFINEIAKDQNDEDRLEYTFRNLHLIMYQAREGFAAELPEVDGEPKSVQEAREFLNTLFEHTAPDDPQYVAPTPPGLPAGTQAAPPPPLSPSIEDGVDEGDEYPAVDVDTFANHMDQLHVHRAAVKVAELDDEYSALFERVASAIIPFHEEMNFNAKLTDGGWATLELQRFKALRQLRPEHEQHCFHRDFDTDGVAESKFWLTELFDFIAPKAQRGRSNSDDSTDHDQGDHSDPDHGHPDHAGADHGDSNDDDFDEDDDLNPGLYGNGGPDDRYQYPPGPQYPSEPRPLTPDLEDIDLDNLKGRLEDHDEKFEKATPPKGDKRRTQAVDQCAPAITKWLRRGLKALVASGGDVSKDTITANTLRSTITRIRDVWVANEPDIVTGLGGLNDALRGICKDLKLQRLP